jgi:sporulation protein YlmC with PRC-barrel domain
MNVSNQNSSDVSNSGAHPDAIEEHGRRVVAASKLDGDTIYSADGKDVGKMKEIMLDMHSGRIAYVVLSSGGFLGMGDKLLAIPWHVLTLDSKQKCFKLSISSEKIKNAPDFDKDSWPSMADHAWATSVREYYGIEPGGERDIAAGGYSLPGTSSTMDADRNL